MNVINFRLRRIAMGHEIEAGTADIYDREVHLGAAVLLRQASVAGRKTLEELYHRWSAGNAGSPQTMEAEWLAAVEIEELLAS